MPLFPPLQLTGVFTVDTLNTVDCEIVVVAVAVQRCASVTVIVYVPDVRPEAFTAVPPDGDHEYV